MGQSGAPLHTLYCQHLLASQPRYTRTILCAQKGVVTAVALMQALGFTAANGVFACLGMLTSPDGVFACLGMLTIPNVLQAPPSLKKSPDIKYLTAEKEWEVCNMCEPSFA